MIAKVKALTERKRFDFKSYIAEVKVLMNENKRRVNKKEDTLK